MGGSKRLFRQNAARLDALIGRLIAATWPSGAGPAPSTPAEAGSRPAPTTHTRSA